MLPLDAPTYSVSTLATEIRDFLAAAFTPLWVRGEVARARASSRGHLYFELVEKGEGDRILARLDCVVWQGDRQRIRRRCGNEVILEEGREVRLLAEIDFYTVGGRLQLVVRSVDPEYTLGRLALRREETLQTLHSAGLLERNAGLSLPEAPLVIGLVTSRDSAAYHDFLASLRRSGFGFRVLFAHAAVQGNAAEEEIPAALALLAGQPIAGCALVRGGGSRSDLAVFDSRRIAEAVALSPFPVLTGLGHEIDRSVTDRVAHTALSTPTQVAELLVERLGAAADRYRQAADSVGRVARQRLDRERLRLAVCRDRLLRLGAAVRLLARRLATLAGTLASASRRAVRHRGERLDGTCSRLVAAATFRRTAAREAERRLAHDLLSSVRSRIRTRRVQLDGLLRLARQLSPQRTLQRGFSVTRDAQGRLLRSAERVRPGDRIHTRLAAGEIQSRVEE